MIGKESPVKLRCDGGSMSKERQRAESVLEQVEQLRARLRGLGIELKEI
ncbi:hypothetical protein [Microcystis aeruginosa]|nr:hypothetical protein [Microcystis aeruginosa]